MWARGRGNGWGQNGELQFFIKIGRDPNNFYLYRTPASAGATRAAWEPEVRVRFEKFFALRAKLEGAYLNGSRRFTLVLGRRLRAHRAIGAAGRFGREPVRRV